MAALGSWATAILRTHQHSFTQAHTPSENGDKTTVCDLAVFSGCARAHLTGPHLHLHPYFHFAHQNFFSFLPWGPFPGELPFSWT